MEQFDPEIQRTFNHAPKIDPFGDPQAEYEHAQRVARQAQNHFAPVPAPFSDLVPNETQKPAAALLIDGPIPYFD